MLRRLLSTEAPWSRWTEAALVVMIWTLVASVALVIRALDPDHPFTLHTIAVTSVEYLPWMLLTPVIFLLAERFPLERDNWVKHLLLHLCIAAIVSFGLRQVQQFTMAQLGPPPHVVAAGGNGRGTLPPLPPGRRPMDRRGGPAGGPGSSLFFPLPVQALIYLMVLGVGFARTYAVELRARRAETERLASQLSEARLQALRMQLNPHFLFNALNAVSALAEDDPAAVRRIVSRLSGLLRRVLDGDARKEVSLREELASLNDYLDIQKIRFGDRLESREEIQPDAFMALVPAFILQPLVENAVEHAAAHRIDGTALITLRAWHDDAGDSLVVIVSDNGSGNDAIPAASGHTGIGLRNIRERLEAHYGGEAKLTLRELEEGGMEAEVVVPYRV